MKLALIGYVPPPKVVAAEAFLKNLERFQRSTDLILFSEHDWPDTIRLKGDPEAIKRQQPSAPHQKANPFALNNWLFFTALRIAIDQGITHIIYLESDCRVGKNDWDSVMWEQYFSAHQPSIIGGTPAVYNPMNAGIKAARRWEALVSQNNRRNYPIATYGWKGAADASGCCVFVNGALGIYDVRWMAKFFDVSDTMPLAKKSTAWDMQIGIELWNRFGDSVYDLVLHMPCIYSSYGDVISTEQDRLRLLRNGDVVGIHQCKSAVVI